eukprot:CAMPEP_0198506078 /NCGR_PEP_ID=MMETSP1462-20131121/11448_1 /TAXON_ID=1333877 /ORGANISM="Brandtodinium nutriculum, Strain RCC3387" /LENGTH=44 /DNA_ID= /DNA_START= /DNA_END= /DNA_ORIENTATION=
MHKNMTRQFMRSSAASALVSKMMLGDATAAWAGASCAEAMALTM